MKYNSTKSFHAKGAKKSRIGNTYALIEDALIQSGRSAELVSTELRFLLKENEINRAIRELVIEGN